MTFLIINFDTKKSKINKQILSLSPLQSDVFDFGTFEQTSLRDKQVFLTPFFQVGLELLVYFLSLSLSLSLTWFLSLYLLLFH